MPHRIATFVCLASLFASTCQAQVINPGAAGWRPPGSKSTSATPAQYNHLTNDDITPTPTTPGNAVMQTNVVTPTAGYSHAQVTKGSGTLPNEHGQVWRDYDISSYTMRMQDTSTPEQAIVDWILRETGYETWHSTPFGILSADNRTLRVYHTPQMQSTVAEIADRFVNNQAENHGFGLRIITVDNPNWRGRALPLMKPLPVESPGVQGWMLAREDAALLMAELRRRTDYREHNPPHQMVRNGQSLTVSTMRNRPYTKGIIRTQQAWPGYQPELGQLEEGFSLEFSPLLSLDTKTTDAVVKLKLAQVEKMVPVKLEVPSNVAPNQRAECQVPQMTMVQLHERFRWPTDQVLLLSMGVVATPGPKKPNMLTDAIPLPLGNAAPRADALLFVESKGPVAPTLPGSNNVPATATRPNTTYHGRY